MNQSIGFHDTYRLHFESEILVLLAIYKICIPKIGKKSNKAKRGLIALYEVGVSHG